MLHPQVREASVRRPDREWGEVVVAYVVGETAGLTRLPRAHPLQAAEGLRVRQGLPKNNYGKILKTELRERDAGRQRPSS